MIAAFLYSLSAIALLISWLVPNHYQPWLGFYNESIAVLGLLALSTWLLIRKKNNSQTRIALPLAALLFLTLTLIPPLQAVLGIMLFWGDAWITSLFLAMIGLSIIVGYGVAGTNGSKLTTTLAIVLLLAAVTSFYLALCQWFGITLDVWLLDAPFGGTPYANIGQRNILATLFCFGLIATFYLREGGFVGNISTLLITLLLLVGLAMTRSRTPFLIMVVLAVWILWKREYLQLKLNKTAVITGTGIFALLWFTWPNIAVLVDLTAEPSLGRLEGAASGEIRLTLWRQLIEAAWRQPLSGYGWNQVSLAQLEVAADSLPSTGVQYAHNIIIDFILWNSPLLGLALTAVGAWWFVIRLKECRTLDTWFCLSILLIMAVHSMLETPHTYAFFLVPAGLCIGVIEQAHGATKIHIPLWNYALAVLFGWGMLTWVSSEYLAAEEDYRLMRFESAKIGSGTGASSAADLKLLTKLKEKILLGRTTPSTEMTADEISWMEKTSHRNPSPENLSKLALAQGLNGQTDRSARTLQTLEKLYGRRNLQHTKRRWLAYACDYPELGSVITPWKLEKCINSEEPQGALE